MAKKTVVIGFLGTVIYSAALVAINHVYLPRMLPPALRPGKISFCLLLVSCAAYLVLALLYLAALTEFI